MIRFSIASGPLYDFSRLGEPVGIPLPGSVPLFETFARLDGREYLLNFDWNDRVNSWFWHSSIDGKALSSSRRLVCSTDLFGSYKHLREAPRGVLTLADYSDRGGAPPELHDLGTRCRLVYFSSSLVDETEVYDLEAIA